jgi:hypothetical protein
MYAAPCGGSFVEAQNALLSECSMFEGAPRFRVLYASGVLYAFTVLHLAGALRDHSGHTGL